MTDTDGPTNEADGDRPSGDYVPPTVTYLGDLAELTQEKVFDASDGMTLAGIPIGLS